MPFQALNHTFFWGQLSSVSGHHLLTDTSPWPIITVQGAHSGSYRKGLGYPSKMTPTPVLVLDLQYQHPPPKMAPVLVMALLKMKLGPYFGASRVALPKSNTDFREVSQAQCLPFANTSSVLQPLVKLASPLITPLRFYPALEADLLASTLPS